MGKNVKRVPCPACGVMIGTKGFASHTKAQHPDYKRPGSFRPHPYHPDIPHPN
ncbi:hypothetical protein ACFLX5_02210 [Chloroflexota bacterium]